MERLYPGLLLPGLLLLPAAAAAQDLAFSPVATETCLAAATDDPQACIGLAAEACMAATSDGGTTVGMGFCLDAEYRWWDDRLNLVYRRLLADHQAADREAAADGVRAPSLAEGLVAMQRAWIPFRDAACAYEVAHWGGGTGGGPAAAECRMRLTGEQALALALRIGRDGP
jgi:uncharacterized protein YecT (DUF1311 family)